MISISRRANINLCDPIWIGRGHYTKTWLGNGIKACIIVLFLLVRLSIGCLSLGAQVHYEPLYSFGFGETSGVQPVTPPIEGSDGYLYGSTFYGGSHGLGTIFRVRKDGSDYRALHSFTNDPPFGVTSPLLEGSDGRLFVPSYGAVVRLNRDGSGYTRLALTQGANATGLIETHSGHLLGVTRQGGNNGAGSVFSLNKDGSGFLQLRSFSGFVDGAYPGILHQSSDSMLYGFTEFGGATNAGTFYRMREDGSGFEVLFHFGMTPSAGVWPKGSIVEDSAGFFYGVTFTGGSNKAGTVFRINRDGTGFATLHHFHYAQEQSYAPNQLVIGSDDLLYGTTTRTSSQENGGVFKLNKDGTGFLELHRFSHSPVDGSRVCGVIEAGDGFLYGTTSGGGAAWEGTLFKLSRDGSEFQIIKSMSRAGGSGSMPASVLLDGQDNFLYGTTSSGGTNGGGTAFRFDPEDGTCDFLRHFSNSWSSGGGLQSSGVSGLSTDASGALFGTTSLAGVSNQGTIFRLGRDGKDFDELHHFGVVPGDGLFPRAGVLVSSDGSLFGSTSSGGSNRQGTLFRLDRDGSDYRVIHHFSIFAGVSLTNALHAFSPLIEGRNGVLYGVINGSTIFLIGKDGVGYRTLHTIAGGISYPLVLGDDGAIYGTTERGGAFSRGTIFRLHIGSSNLVSHVLSPSENSTVGQRPVGGLVEGADGMLYGRTSQGGASNRGVLFRVRKDDLTPVGLYPITNANSFVTGLSAGADGCLYGVSYNGGQMRLGEIYRWITPSLTRVFAKPSWQGLQLLWKSVPGVTYRIQTKNRLSDSEWTFLAEDVLAVGTTATKFIEDGGPHQYYRAVAFP